MRKDRFLKRLFCAAAGLLLLAALVRDFRELIGGRGNSRILFIVLALLADGHYFFHPDDFSFGDVKKGLRSYVGFALSIGGVLGTAAYLWVGLRLGIAGWQRAVAIFAAATLVGLIILFPEKFFRKKGRKRDADVQQPRQTKED